MGVEVGDDRVVPPVAVGVHHVAAVAVPQQPGSHWSPPGHSPVHGPTPTSCLTGLADLLHRSAIEFLEQRGYAGGALEPRVERRHGVRVGGATSSAPPATAAAVAVCASSTSSATRKCGATRRPTSTSSIISTWAVFDSSSVARPASRIDTSAPPSPA